MAKKSCARAALLTAKVAVIAIVLLITPATCGTSGCLAECQSEVEVVLNPAIGQPGSYQFSVGSHECSVRLPAVSSDCATIRGFSIVGFRFAEARPSRELPVNVFRDGAEVVSTAALQEDTASAVCGQTCHYLKFRVDVPAELAASVRPPCDRNALSGSYAITESGHTGGCESVFNGRSTVLLDGLLQMPEPGCESQLLAWSPTTCRLQAATTCALSSGEVTWNIDLIDVIGDGSDLIGTGKVSLSGAVKCEGSAGLELVRQ